MKWQDHRDKLAVDLGGETPFYRRKGANPQLGIYPISPSGRIAVSLLLLALPAFAQSLSLSCPTPAKNKPAVCPINFTGTSSGLQWVLAATPAVKLTMTTSAPGKSLAVNGTLYILIGMNSTPLAGTVAAVTVPVHSGTVVLSLAQVLGTTAAGKAVAVAPAVSVSVQ